MIAKASRQFDLESVRSLIASPGRKDLIISGESGVGKTTLLAMLHKSLGLSSNNLIIDASQTSARTRLGLASNVLASTFSDEANRFFSEASGRKTQGRFGANTFAAIDIFRRSLTSIAREHPYIFLDNVDRLSEELVIWLSEECEASNGPRLVLTTQNAKNFPERFSNYPLGAFSESDVTAIVSGWSGVQDFEEVARICFQHSEGNGVQLALCRWAFEKLTLQQFKEATGLQELISCAIDHATPGERDVLQLTLSCDRRINSRIVSLLGGQEAQAEFQSHVLHSPFYVRFEDQSDDGRIHDIARRSLAKALGENPEKTNIQSRLAYEVYPRLITSAEGDAFVRTLKLEGLAYKLSSDLVLGAKWLDDEFDKGRNLRDFVLCDALGELANEFREKTSPHTPMRLKLVLAESFVLTHDVQSALDLLRGVSAIKLRRESSDVRIRVKLLKGICATSDAPISGYGPLEGLKLMRECYEEPDLSVSEHEGRVLYEYAIALTLSGRNSEALNILNELSESNSNTHAALVADYAATRILLLMQRVDDARAALSRATERRISLDIGPVGMEEYLRGNILRDSDDFDQASEIYVRARELLTDERDIHGLCCLYGDWAWMNYLADDIEAMRSNLEQYKTLSSRYGFWREISEYWHMVFHLEIDEGRSEQAYSALDTAYELAAEYGNIYMQLDCLMHLVAREVEREDIEAALDLISEMKTLEELGAGISVFRGRALIYLGDLYLRLSQMNDAYRNWCSGFELVARFGNSRTNVELLQDYLDDRLEKFRAIEVDLSYQQWPPADLVQAVPALQALGQE